VPYKGVSLIRLERGEGRRATLNSRRKLRKTLKEPGEEPSKKGAPPDPGKEGKGILWGANPRGT